MDAGYASDGIPARKRRNPGSFRNFGHGRPARMAQLERMSPKQRSRAARHAAVIRWTKVRAELHRGEFGVHTEYAEAPTGACRDGSTIGPRHRLIIQVR